MEKKLQRVSSEFLKLAYIFELPERCPPFWESALAQEALQKNLELYMTFELQRRMTIFFDLATCHNLRQSRRLVNVNRSKRSEYEPPEGGYSSNILS